MISARLSRSWKADLIPDMVREAISNMMAPEVGADTISVQHFSHPDYNASFIFKDDGIGMSYTGSDEKPGGLIVSLA